MRSIRLAQLPTADYRLACMVDWCGLICDTSQEHDQDLAVGMTPCLEATAPSMNILHARACMPRDASKMYVECLLIHVMWHNLSKTLWTPVEVRSCHNQAMTRDDFPPSCKYY